MDDPLRELANRERLAFVGVAKNCGKTTTLNGLLRRRESAPPALLSLGIDGEEEDVLLGTTKPPILVQPGQWIVTARRYVEDATARLSIVASLGLETPLGEVYLCQVRTAGALVLAGLRQRQEVLRALDLLRAHQVSSSWLDGAYGRISGAHPDLQNAVVLSTGAIAGPGLEATLAATTHLLDRLTTPGTTGATEVELICAAIKENRVLYKTASPDHQSLRRRSALLGLKELHHPDSPALTALAIPGLISDRVAEELLAITVPENCPLLIPDGTVLHLSPRHLRRLRERFTLQALHPIEVAAISYNPTILGTPALAPQALKEALCDVAPPGCYVFDPLKS